MISGLQLPTVATDSDRFSRHVGMNRMCFQQVALEVEKHFLWH
jgi:hypothetical protein